VDFPYLLFADQVGEIVMGAKGRAGVGWLRLITDIPTAASDLWHGHLSPKAYFHSLMRTRVESVFSIRDPLPSIAEVLMLPYLVTKKYIL
jgi:D-aspartate ligase